VQPKRSRCFALVADRKRRRPACCVHWRAPSCAHDLVALDDFDKSSSEQTSKSSTTETSGRSSRAAALIAVCAVAFATLCGSVQAGGLRHEHEQQQQHEYARLQANGVGRSAEPFRLDAWSQERRRPQRGVNGRGPLWPRPSRRSIEQSITKLCSGSQAKRPQVGPLGSELPHTVSKTSPT
jgi:hypothetical protein